MSDIIYEIPKLSWELSRLVKTLDTGGMVTQDFYEEYEYNILQMSIAIAVDQQWLLYKKIRLELDMTERHEEYKKTKETNWEKYTFADWERATESQYRKQISELKELESVSDMYNKILQSYRRYGEVMKSRIISDMSDAKRADLAMMAQR